MPSFDAAGLAAANRDIAVGPKSNRSAFKVSAIVSNGIRGRALGATFRSEAVEVDVETKLSKVSKVALAQQVPAITGGYL